MRANKVDLAGGFEVMDGQRRQHEVEGPRRKRVLEPAGVQPHGVPGQRLARGDEHLLAGVDAEQRRSGVALQHAPSGFARPMPSSRIARASRPSHAAATSSCMRSYCGTSECMSSR